MSKAPSTPSAKYVCDPNCGACCKGHLIVEVEDIDIIREPRLIEADRHHAGKTIEKMLDDYQRGMVVIISCSKPCPFLAENKCTIYPTRPNCCVAFEAGSDDCQDCRRAEGLPPLLPVQEPPVIPRVDVNDEPLLPPSDVRRE